MGYKRGVSRTTSQRYRICLGVIVSLLFCALGSLEIPELVKLVDDCSNDFTILHSPQEINPPVVAKQAASVDSPQMHAPGWIPEAIETIPVVAIHPHTSDELIRFLCVQRT